MVGLMMRYSSPLPDTSDWREYVISLLWSVQRKDILLLKVNQFFGTGSEEVLAFLNELNYEISWYGGVYRYVSVPVDIEPCPVVFLSNSDRMKFHQIMVYEVYSYCQRRGLKLRRSLRASRQVGADVELLEANLEIETGLKKDFSALERRAEQSEFPVFVITPNSSVEERYRAHFGYSGLFILTISKFRDYISRWA